MADLIPCLSALRDQTQCHLKNMKHALVYGDPQLSVSLADLLGHP